MPPLTIDEIRRQLAQRRGKAYWRSLDELADSDRLHAVLTQALPHLDALWDTPLTRRRMLKLMAASMALGGLTGCDRQPEEHLVPYVDMPEYGVPGTPRHYATTALVAGYAHGVLAQSHEGRPTKIEGNPAHPATLGACDTAAQASVLSLYDPDRSGAVRQHGSISGYGNLLAALSEKQEDWDSDGGRGLCLLTGRLTSPSAQAHLQALQRQWPQARLFTHEAVDRQAVYAGSRQVFGEAIEPVYRLTEAQVVLALDADVLHEQPGFLRYAHDLFGRRRPRDADGIRNRLYAVESTPGITGAVADHRLALTHPRIEDLARQLAVSLGMNIPGPVVDAAPPAWVRALAADLQSHRGAAVVIPGDRQSPAVHAIAQAINHRLQAFGATVEAIAPVDAAHEAGTLAELTTAMHAGEVDSLVMLDCNPVYTAPADLGFAEALDRVPWRLHWGEYVDETARLAHWHVPAAHPLETWGDARAYDGTASLIQPLIRPLQGGKTLLQMLVALTEATAADAHALLQAHWRERNGSEDFEAFWRRSLHDGLIAGSAFAARPVSPRAGWVDRLPAPRRGNDELVLQLRPDPALWDGRYANNGWLQELPRPLTTLTWGNAALIAPALAAQHELAEGDVVRLALENRELELPVYILPGHPPDAVTVHLGHGRRNAGRVGEDVGVDAYRLRDSRQPWALRVTLTPLLGEHRALALTQRHHAMEGRDLIRATDLAHYRTEPGFAQRPQPHESLYPEPWPAEREAQHAWGMVIDLSACIGCNACVTACQAENNIPIVGREEVTRGREMHWIRIDRYFEGGPDAPGVVFQPVTCMHCENAPCEYVCPVGATQHSADGLNEMVYNRCIGTRYCSQNCPYKVRRFNWFDYTGATAAYPAEPAVQNPEVTVRSRGVMEKCTYCVQRINATRTQADAANRPIVDGELLTACQQACPTQAIVFGDLADAGSEVKRLTDHPLNYALLGELNTRPRTTYLAAVRNPNPAIADDEA